MTRKELAARAFSECCSEKTAVRHGQTGGFPFWNAESLQFMYAPAFHFTAIRMKPRYRYDAVDELGVTHSFTADGCCARLTPIWAELPEGVLDTATGKSAMAAAIRKGSLGDSIRKLIMNADH